MIQITNLQKQFDGIAAVQDLSFTAPDGQITGLLGPNGAGKSTTLRAIFGILQADAGSIRVDGTEAQSDPRMLQPRVGALPDHIGLYPRLTARENVRYFGDLHGLSETQVEARIAHLFSVLGMEQIAQRTTAGFSQGERMKTALARALVHDPQNVLLDEPTSGLDVLAVRALREFLRGLRAAGKCVVFSSHVLDEVQGLCDQVIVIARGRVVAQGTPQQLCRETGCSTLEDAFVQLIGSREETSCLSQL